MRLWRLNSLSAERRRQLRVCSLARSLVSPAAAASDGGVGDSGAAAVVVGAAIGGNLVCTAGILIAGVLQLSLLNSGDTKLCDFALASGLGDECGAVCLERGGD